MANRDYIKVRSGKGEVVLVIVFNGNHPVGLALTPDVARELAMWIIQEAENAEKAE